MASEVSICNQAISWLGGSRIIRLDEKSREADLCNDNYAELRDAVLSEMAWTFATTRILPAKDANPPAWGYSSSFEMGSGILSVLEVRTDPNTANGASNIDWRFEENKILCDADVIYVKAIKQITDPNKFHPTFRQALAARIAAEICIPLTGNRALFESMVGLYERKLDTAAATDGVQGTKDKIVADQYIKVRRGKDLSY